MKISITLPSVSPKLVYRAIESIKQATTTHRIEILACTPFDVVEDRGIVRVPDKLMTGCVAAHAAAARAATGDFITSFADDHDYVRGWDEKAVENFLRQESVFIRNRPMSRVFCLGLRQVSPTPHVGTMFGIYYPYFPLMRLHDVRNTGGWYDASLYKNGFSDPDLGMRVWASGGRCEWADEATVVPRPEDAARRGAPDYLEDARTFLRRWSGLWGAGWDLRHVRGWDLDVPLDTFGPDERSCFCDERVKKFVRATEDV